MSRRQNQCDELGSASVINCKADKWLHNIELLSGCSKDSHVNLG